MSIFVASFELDNTWTSFDFSYKEGYLVETNYKIKISKLLIIEKFRTFFHMDSLSPVAMCVLAQ